MNETEFSTWISRKTTETNDFLNVYISLPISQMDLETEKGKETRERKRIKISSPETDRGLRISALALLDTGCLVGDCISKEIVSKLNAQHLVVYNSNTVICSGFDNNCSDKFPTLIINISYLNERNSLIEVFQTTVFVLPKTSIDLIIGRTTLKKQRFSLTTPSHFEDQTNLTDNVRMTTEPFGDLSSQELYGITPLNQEESKGSPFKAHAHLTNEIHSCKSNFKSDDETVGLAGLTGNKQSVRRVREKDPMCLLANITRGSCIDGGSCPCSVQQAQAKIMRVSGPDGLNETHLLAPVTKSDTPPFSKSDTPPLTPGKTRELSKKWLLQEDGSYKPIYLNLPASSSFNSSMIHLSDESPVESRRGVHQTWGVIATLIKQQEQLNVSQRQVADSAFITDNEEIIREDIIDDDFNDTLDTEHDVFNDFRDSQGDDPNTDILDCIVIEGTPNLE